MKQREKTWGPFLHRTESICNKKACVLWFIYIHCEHLLFFDDKITKENAFLSIVSPL